MIYRFLFIFAIVYTIGLFISFGSWRSSHGKVFVQKRYYIKGYKWTPFLRVSLRKRGKK